MIAINPQFDWRRFGGNALQDIGYGLGRAPTVAGGFAAGAERSQDMQPYRDQQATLEEERRRDALEKNQTSEWIKANFPQYSNLPPAQAWQAAMGDLAAKRSAASSGAADDPASIREWQTFNAMTPEQQGQYLRMKRANPYLDVGNGFVQPDPINPGLTSGPAISKSGDVPTGYQQGPQGTIAPMAGGPQAQDVLAGKTKAVTALNTLEQKNQIAVSAIDKALTNASGWTTGIAGSLTSAVPGTPAYDLARTLDTIKANIGFDELQTMRDNSPTGGALGQVTERELAFLQSTIANIEQAQSEAQLRENLAVLKQYLTGALGQRRAAYEQQFGAAQGGATYTFNPATGELE